MPTFDYSAYNTAGKLVNGVISADSERQARRQLKDKKLLPSTLDEVSKKASGKSSRRGREAKVDNLDLSLLLHQQAILIQSGLPLEESLRMTIEQAETDKQRRLVESWRSEITEGRSFSEALRRSPYKIPESIVAGVGVGEETGHLYKILLRLSEELETSAENRKTVTRALIYPVTLISVSIIMVSIMMVWVVPKITAVFASSKRDLPWITEVVVAISNFTQNYGLFIVGFVMLAILVFNQAMKRPELKLRWHSMILSTPGMGRWVRMADISDWSRNLGVLLSSGVPALAALKISSAVVSNLALQSRFDRITEAMRQGTSLHKALEDNLEGSGFLVHMVGSGEASSELDKMLLRVAEYYSARLNNAVEVFLKLLNPILILIMGAMILGIVAAIMLPIMDMNNTI
ncbi:MAG: type II secretion system F family protein [Porticoccaceae bacterium]|jgi:general secretion pathway protein F|nr:general secretion pathway protein GspF [Porticoccaceae bacterium]MBT6780160.1 general secretion pathway protein GspF [Porticoccaceae bacterium]MBT7563977.1 general secretion pathway protein GspF [Porticoccaceae bacterium]MDB2566324.1 type II secretion system F family protein [Porticoccaceae bacterium]MDB2621128.1 type II secretion system F family protein [Porticoccaceae bacterium]|tara:strand:+ start:7940 stop:9151 length:1212 start_codon:yes stop_codon:yes gene_type:complete